MNHVQYRIYSRDEEYIRDIRAGGSIADAAISGLYLKYRKRAFAYFSKLVDKHGEYKSLPEDLAHDSFIVMLDKIREDAYCIASLSGLWLGIGKNLLLNQLKKDQRTILVHDPEAVYETHQAATLWGAEDEREEEILLHAISGLCQRCQEILLLWINRYTMTEITQIMKLTNLAMARKTKYECFKKLKKMVKSGHIPGE